MGSIGKNEREVHTVLRRDCKKKKLCRTIYLLRKAEGTDFCKLTVTRSIKDTELSVWRENNV